MAASYGDYQRYLALKSEGLSLAKISRELGLESTLVKRWNKGQYIPVNPNPETPAKVVQLAKMAEQEVRSYAIQVAMTMGGANSSEYKAFLDGTQKTFPPKAFRLPIDAADDLELADRLLTEILDSIEPEDNQKPEVHHDVINVKSKLVEHRKDLALKRMVLYEKYMAAGMPSILPSIMAQYAGIDQLKQETAMAQVLAVILSSKMKGEPDIVKVREMIGEMVK